MKVVKADAKGRVTGFEPGVTYNVTSEADNWQEVESLEPGDVGKVIGVSTPKTAYVSEGLQGSSEVQYGTLKGYTAEYGTVVGLALSQGTDEWIDVQNSYSRTTFIVSR